MPVAITNTPTQSTAEENINIRQEKLGELEDAEKRLSEIRSEIRTLEDEREQIITKAVSDPKASIKASKVRQDHVEKEIKKLENEAAELECTVQTLGDELAKLSRIDKYRILKNIRNAMKAKDIKVGQIEFEAGCSTGYMSRLENRKNTTSPSLEFITAASDMLGIDMDLIVKGHIDELSKTDMYMLEFISELVAQTSRGEITWTRENLSANGDYGFYDYQKGYQSLFYEDARECDDVPALCAKLPGSDNRLFLVSVKLLDKDDIGVKFAEVYLVDKDDNRTPLYNTNDSKALLEETRTLYLAAQKSSKSIQLADNARAAIDQFMATRK